MPGTVRFAALAAGAAVAVVAGPVVGRGWLPEEVLAARLPPPTWVRAAAVVVAGLLAGTLAGLAGRWAERAGAFGVAAGAALAAALAGVLLAWPELRAAWPRIGLVVAGAGVVGAVLAPLLRDRGLGSLLLVSLLLGGALAAGRRLALEERQRAEELAGARDAVLQAAWTRLFVSVAPGVPLAFRQALARSLRPPFHPETIDLLCVERESDEARDLRAAGLGGVDLGAARGQRLDPPPHDGALPIAPFPFRVEARMLEDHGPVVVVTPPEGRFVLCVVTPAGVVEHADEDPVHGLRLSGAALDRYRALVGPLPPGMPLLVRVEAPGLEHASAWQELRL